MKFQWLWCGPLSASILFAQAAVSAENSVEAEKSLEAIVVTDCLRRQRTRGTDQRANRRTRERFRVVERSHGRRLRHACREPRHRRWLRRRQRRLASGCATVLEQWIPAQRVPERKFHQWIR